MLDEMSERAIGIKLTAGASHGMWFRNANGACDGGPRANSQGGGHICLP